MTRSLKAVINSANPNTLPDALRGIGGYALAAAPAFYKGTVASNKLTLPEGAKAAWGLVAYATAGTVTGQMTFDPDGTPGTGTFSVNPNGDLIFFATDAVTAVEVLYIPQQGEIIEELVFVSSNVGLLGGGRTARTLLSVNVTAGTALGAKTAIARAGSPSAGQAAINLLGTGIAFQATDAVTQAVVRYIAAPKFIDAAGVTSVSVADALARDSNLL